MNPHTRDDAARDQSRTREAYRRHRVYVNTTIAPYEDGYALPMLEAMASGMPVVSTGSATSPIEHGINGLAERDLARLRVHVLQLLEDPAFAARLGRAARETIAASFPLTPFLTRWRALLDAVVAGDHTGRGALEHRRRDRVSASGVRLQERAQALGPVGRGLALGDVVRGDPGHRLLGHRIETHPQIGRDGLADRLELAGQPQIAQPALNFLAERRTLRG